MELIAQSQEVWFRAAPGYVSKADIEFISSAIFHCGLNPRENLCVDALSLGRRRFHPGHSALDLLVNRFRTFLHQLLVDRMRSLCEKSRDVMSAICSFRTPNSAILAKFAGLLKIPHASATSAVSKVIAR